MMVKSFCSHKHIKTNGKVASFTYVSKFKDDILWESKLSNYPLPPSFYAGIETYLTSYKACSVRSFLLNNCLSLVLNNCLITTSVHY